MLQKLVRFLAKAVALILLAAAITFLYLGWRINRTGHEDGAHLADAIVVLGARVSADGVAGPDLRVRTLHAVDLYQRGLAPYLICTGGYQGDRLSAAAVARDLAISMGVPAENILLAENAMTTREDAASVQALMAARNWHTAILVSHPLHLERARLLFEGQGLVAYPSPTNTHLETISWHTRLWLTAREAVGIVWIGLEELGVPYEWTTVLSHQVYGPPEAEEGD